MSRRTPPTTAGLAPATAVPANTRERIKKTAILLFAQHGIDGVAVRDIVVASGQRNAASLHYYFGTKEALVRELVLDGATRINERRHALLDALEAGQAAPELRELLEVLVQSSFEPTSEGDNGGAYLRFIAMLSMQHRDVFLEALGEQGNSGYKRALRLIRKKLDHVSPRILNQRLAFMGIYLGSVLAAREAALAAPQRANTSLRGTLTVQNLLDTLEAMLSAAPSAATREQLL